MRYIITLVAVTAILALGAPVFADTDFLFSLGFQQTFVTQPYYSPLACSYLTYRTAWVPTQFWYGDFYHSHRYGFYRRSLIYPYDWPAYSVYSYTYDPWYGYTYYDYDPWYFSYGSRWNFGLGLVFDFGRDHDRDHDRKRNRPDWHRFAKGRDHDWRDRDWNDHDRRDGDWNDRDWRDWDRSQGRKDDRDDRKTDWGRDWTGSKDHDQRQVKTDDRDRGNDFGRTNAVKPDSRDDQRKVAKQQENVVRQQEKELRKQDKADLKQVRKEQKISADAVESRIRQNKASSIFDRIERDNKIILESKPIVNDRSNRGQTTTRSDAASIFDRIERDMRKQPAVQRDDRSGAAKMLERSSGITSDRKNTSKGNTSKDVRSQERSRNSQSSSERRSNRSASESSGRAKRGR